jgi:N-acetylglucosamine-6-phosphate deacetylase
MTAWENGFPGFVDLQVNGYMGVDFTDPEMTEDDFKSACDELLNHGTAAFLPTIITSPQEVYEHNLPLISSVIAKPEYQGRLLGIHLEGPFISRKPGAVGAHNPLHVLKPDLTALQKLLDMAQGKVKLLTVAAELPGIDMLIEYAVARDITVSIGHSLFDTPALHTATRAGAQALTHLGNGLPNILSRHPNPLWSGLAYDAMTAMLITDGHHLPSEVIKVAVSVKSSKYIVVVSDASPVAGLQPGHYIFSGNEAVLEPSGRFYNPVKQCLVGSSATMLECMNYLASLRLFSIDELLEVGVHNPLRLIGLKCDQIDLVSKVVYESSKQVFSLLE